MTNSAASYPAPRQTVFKRKKQANFTILGNAVLFDARLDLDEGMAIVKLLAKPHDWQIHPLALRKEWRVGRDKFYRIINKLIRLGYITRGEMIKDTWGRFIACEYIVTDEPEAPPAEVDDDDFSPIGDDTASDDGGGEEVATPNDTGVAVLPHAGFPDTGEPHAENQHPEKELRNIQTNPPVPPPPSQASNGGNVAASPCREPQATPMPNRSGPAGGPRGPAEVEPWKPDSGDVPTFEQFIARYKPERHMSIEGGHRRWLRMTDRDKIEALQYLDAFLDDRRAKGWKLPDLRRYLLDKHWMSYAQAARDKPPRVAIKPYSPQWYRWREYRIATGQNIKFFDHYPTQYRGDWTEPSEWPPPLPPKEHRAGQSTEPDQQGDHHGT